MKRFAKILSITVYPFLISNAINTTCIAQSDVATPTCTVNNYYTLKKKWDIPVFEITHFLRNNLLRSKKTANEKVKIDQLSQVGVGNLFSKKETQIEILKQRQLLIVLGIGLFFVGVVIYFLVRLRNYQKKIERLTKHHQEMYTIIAHDLREPISSLSGISSAIKFLIKNKRDNDLQKMLDDIENHANKSLLLVNNLLEWGILKNYQVKDNVEAVDISKLVKEIAKYYSFIADQKGVTIVTKLAEVEELMTNPKAIEIIVRNLIDNAQKFTTDGGKIEVSLERIAHQKQVRIDVKNTGQMKVEKLSYIKKVFSNKIKPEIYTEGLGLGIILINDFANKINGSVSVESCVEDGTVFSLILPKK